MPDPRNRANAPRTISPDAPLPRDLRAALAATAALFTVALLAGLGLAWRAGGAALLADIAAAYALTGALVGVAALPTLRNTRISSPLARLLTLLVCTLIWLPLKLVSAATPPLARLLGYRFGR